MNLDKLLIDVSTPELLEEEFNRYKKIKTDELISPPKVNIQVGVDGVSWEGFEKDIKNQCLYISNRIKNGTYFFNPFREVPIAKKANTQIFKEKKPSDERIISISCIRDVLAQRVIYKAINEQIESEFSEYQNISFAYRKGKSAPEAAQLIYKYILSGYTFVLDADIEGFFDNISHKITMDKIGGIIDVDQDPILYSYMRRFISVDRVKWEDYKKNYKKFHNVKPKRTVRQKGIPQGGVLSGLIANLFLHDFDKWIINELGKRFDLKYVRYADDFVVLMKDLGKVGTVKRLIKEKLDEIELKLHSNPEKTKKIDLTMIGTYVDFVGFSISPTGIRIKHSNIVRFKSKLSEMIDETSFFEGKKKLNPLISKFTYKLLGNETLGLRKCISCSLYERRRSWINYFSIITDVQQLRGLDFWIRKQLYNTYFKETGKRLKAIELSQYQLPRFERLYYRTKKIKIEKFCSCEILARDFQREVLVDHLFKYS